MILCAGPPLEARIAVIMRSGSESTPGLLPERFSSFVTWPSSLVTAVQVEYGITNIRLSFLVSPVLRIPCNWLKILYFPFLPIRVGGEFLKRSYVYILPKIRGFYSFPQTSFSGLLNIRVFHMFLGALNWSSAFKFQFESLFRWEIWGC